MNRYLKKAVFVQSIPYSPSEFRLAQYHGAIFADKLRDWGVDATKMVLGDPNSQVPISPLLSVSSQKQRMSPDYWRAQAYDLVVLYGGEDVRNIPMMRAVKSGSPDTILVLKMDAAYGPFSRTPREILRAAHIAYVKDRHGHSGKYGHASSPPLLACVKAIKRMLRMLTPSYVNDLAALFSAPDYVSYESESALAEAKQWLCLNKRSPLASKVIWLGYPVRDAFAFKAQSVPRKLHSIISVANWKHAKDINLHAKALAKVFHARNEATFLLIGENSHALQKRILQYAPNADHRITRINEIFNAELPKHLNSSQVFMLCSFTEGYCSAVVEALCCGCSVALSTGAGVPCFKEFARHNCGTQAKSRTPADMTEAVTFELNAWEHGERQADVIQRVWEKTLVSNLCKHICTATGLRLPD